MVSWVLRPGFHKVAIKVTAGLYSHLEVGLGKNPRPSFLIYWQIGFLC